MINIALPKGRLGEKAYALFEKAGYGCPEAVEGGRKLLFENREKGICYFWVKPLDAAIYVSRGVADIGVCGKDALMEQAPDVYEMLDLKIGRCRMDVAAMRGFRDDRGRRLRVATKFPRVAAAYYEELGRDIDVIQLSGSIELAPLLRLSDVIVDIVETGATLRENGLQSIATLFPVSARLIANKSAWQFKRPAMEEILLRLKEGCPCG